MSDASIMPPRTGATVSARLAGIVLLVLLVTGFTSIIWTPYPVNSLDVAGTMGDPGPAHWLGTDQLGRDVLSLTMRAVLTSFVVSAVSVAIGALVGIPLGLAAIGRGWIVRGAAAGVGGYLTAVPAVASAALLAAMFGPSAATVMIALGVASVAPFSAATAQAVTLARGQDYVAAGILAGTGGLDLARRHIWPIVLPALAAAAAQQLSVGMMAEAALSFVGLGVQPPAASLGLLLRDAQAFAAAKPTLLVVPGVTIIVMVACLRLVTRGLRARSDGVGEDGWRDA